MAKYNSKETKHLHQEIYCVPTTEEGLPKESDGVTWTPSLVTQAVIDKYSEAKLGRVQDIMASLEDITNVSATLVSYPCPATEHKGEKLIKIGN